MEGVYNMIQHIKKLAREILLFLRVTINPKYWVMIGTYCEATDKVIRRLIEDDTEIDSVASSGNVVKFDNGIGIWVANYPYGYGNIMDYAGAFGANSEMYPSRRTKYLLNKFISRKKSQYLMKMFDAKE